MAENLVIQNIGLVLSGALEAPIIPDADTIVAVDGRETVTVQTLNEKIVLRRQDIVSINRTPLSIMPEGLMRRFGDGELRDLVAYLAGAGQGGGGQCLGRREVRRAGGEHGRRCRRIFGVYSFAPRQSTSSSPASCSRRNWSYGMLLLRASTT